MTFISVAPANSKTAEFAHLFDLFDRVATRRTRTPTGDISQVISGDDIANVPASFAPVLRNLSTILSLRAHTHTTQSRHPRGVVNNSMPPVSDAIEQVIDTPSFPLGERYPFTFKLMLHKLYDLDEWAEKVKCAVETSKSQFKPLAERDSNVVADAAKKNRFYPPLGASAKFKPPSTTTRRAHSTVLCRDPTSSPKERVERRNSARPLLGALSKFKPLPSVPRYPAHTAASPSARPEASRVVKKRCVGRRKSINGPMSAGVWVYDAAIAAVEVGGARPAAEITLSTPTRQAGSWVETRRVRHRSLPALTDMQTRNAGKRRVKFTVSLLHEVGAESADSPRLSSVLSAEQIESGGAVRKKQLVASVRATVKRPLCV